MTINEAGFGELQAGNMLKTAQNLQMAACGSTFGEFAAGIVI